MHTNMNECQGTPPRSPPDSDPARPPPLPLPRCGAQIEAEYMRSAADGALGGEAEEELVQQRE
jgi:hypothetical protein